MIVWQLEWLLKKKLAGAGGTADFAGLRAALAAADAPCEEEEVRTALVALCPGFAPDSMPRTPPGPGPPHGPGAGVDEAA